jgi:DNA repair protein RadA/Sms
MKDSTIYVCSHCDSQYSKWQGQCDECGKWGTIAEFEAAPSAEPIKLTKKDATAHLSVGIPELESVLGGGIVPGSAILLAGDPGIGKSTLVLQLAHGFMKFSKGTITYICGEESPAQIGLRIQRLGLTHARTTFLPETRLNRVLSNIRASKPSLVVVDSIQTMSHEHSSGEPGSANQIKASTGQFLALAKETNIPIIMIGHVTKEGSIAGPRLLEHMVDVVLYLEGDQFNQYRLLRSTKNRFGPTNQVGVFTMEETGLKEVKNPSQLFLEGSGSHNPGSVVSVVMEGSRAFLIEIQALTNKTSYGYPKRATSGFDAARLELLLAVLSRRAGLALHNQDVFLNVVGGLKVKDPSLDLAASLAIASSLSSQPLPEHSVALGEIGLAGEVRPIAHFETRVREARRLGFTEFYTSSQKISQKNGIHLHEISSLSNALGLLGIKK